MPSFFGVDEFSFLDTYRERSDDEDESDNECSHTSSSSLSEGNDEHEFVYNNSAASFDLPESPAAHNNHEDSDEDDEDKGSNDGGWDRLLASFEESDESDDERTSEGCDVVFGADFGILLDESTSAEENGDEEEISSDGEVSPHINNTDPPGGTNNTPNMMFSIEQVLRDGLFFAGFSHDRIAKCGGKRNTDRFKAHYGVCPMTVVSFLEDLFRKHPSLKYKDVFMTVNWLKTYSVAHVMAAIWGPCEEYINPVLEEYIAKFASLKEGKIRLDRLNDETIIVFSIDACHFMTDEMALDPSTRWYDFKKGGAGVKYEVALSIHSNEIIWIRGPLPASIHDISMFRGYTTKEKKKNKVDKDAFISRIPAGKKGVGDSGSFQHRYRVSTSFLIHSLGSHASPLLPCF